MWTIQSIYEFIKIHVGSYEIPIERLNVWLFLLLICILVVLCIYFTKVDSRTLSLLRKFAGPKPLPIVGNVFAFAVPAREHIGAIENFMNHQSVVLGWIGSQPYLFVSDPDVIQKVLSSNVHIDKTPEYKYVTSWLGTGLLTANGSKWHSRRKLLTPAFHFKILDQFLELFNEHSLVFVDILNQKAISGEAFNICPYITRCTLDIICETAMGEKINAQRDMDSQYVRAIHAISKLLMKRMLQPWFRCDLVWSFTNNRNEEKKLLDILHGFTERVIRSRKAERKLAMNQQDATENQEADIYDKRRKAFLDLLLDASEEGNNVLSDSDIREETDTFMFEGHDTIATSIGYTIFLLALHPKSQRKVQVELESIFGEDQDRLITSTDLSRMKYLECCIKESLRLFPSVPYSGRQLCQDLNLGDGRIMPKGVIVVILAYHLHRDHRIYADSEKYIPERFDSESSGAFRKHPYSYIPFSAGPRNCIGQKFALLELKLVLAQFFRNFNVQATHKLEDLKLIPEIVLRPENGLHVTLIKV